VKGCDTITQKNKKKLALFYLYVSDQQCEEHQATEDIDYAEYHLNTIACWGKIVTKSTAKQFKELYKFMNMQHKKYMCMQHGTRLNFFEVELGYQFDAMFIQINSIRKREYFDF
jgi:hypothetical protein